MPAAMRMTADLSEPVIVATPWTAVIADATTPNGWAGSPRMGPLRRTVYSGRVAVAMATTSNVRPIDSEPGWLSSWAAKTICTVATIQWPSRFSQRLSMGASQRTARPQATVTRPRSQIYGSGGESGPGGRIVIAAPRATYHTPTKIRRPDPSGLERKNVTFLEMRERSDYLTPSPGSGITNPSQGPNYRMR